MIDSHKLLVEALRIFDQFFAGNLLTLFSSVCQHSMHTSTNRLTLSQTYLLAAQSEPSAIIRKSDRTSSEKGLYPSLEQLT
jgi:hypothetical protein